MGQNYIHDLFSLDPLPYGMFPDYKIMHEVKDVHYVVPEKFNNFSVKTIHAKSVLRVPISCAIGELWKSQYYKPPPRNIQNALEKLILHVYENNKERAIRKSNFISAYYDACKTFNSDLRIISSYPLFQEEREFISRLGKDGEYDFSRRFILIDGLPENTLIFTGLPESLGVLVVCSADPLIAHDYEKYFGGFIMDDFGNNFLIYDCDKRFGF